MAFSAGYWIDLSGIKFDETGVGTWIQALPLGDYEHPIHGKISITPDRVQRFADNVKNNVRTQALDIDYDHKATSGDAAGWVKDAANRGQDGLWLLVDWTSTALQKLKEGAYKYFSPEFNDEWTHPKTNVKYQDVLFGGGITNRPFLKDILPINLSEVLTNAQASDPSKSKGGTVMTMTPERMAAYKAKLGLGADATEDQIWAELDSLEIQDAPIEPTPQAIAAAEAIAAAKKLSEGNTALAPIVALMESQAAEVKALKEQAAFNTTALRLSEVNVTVTKLSEKAKTAGFILPPTTKQNLINVLMSGNKQLSDTTITSLEEIIDAKIVRAGELGQLRIVKDEDRGKTATQRLTEATTKLTEGDKGISFAEAVMQVANTDPALYDEYRQESYANQGGGQ